MKARATLHAAVKIEGEDESLLKRIRHNAGAGAPAAEILTAAQTQVVAEVDLLRELEQRLLADEACASGSARPLGAVWTGWNR